MFDLIFVSIPLTVKLIKDCQRQVEAGIPGTVIQRRD